MYVLLATYLTVITVIVVVGAYDIDNNATTTSPHSIHVHVYLHMYIHMT